MFSLKILIIFVILIFSFANPVFAKKYKHSGIFEYSMPNINSSLLGISGGYTFQHYKFLFISSSVGVGYPFLAVIFGAGDRIKPNLFYAVNLGVGPSLYKNIKLSFRFENGFYFVPDQARSNEIVFTRLNSYMGGITSAPWYSGSYFHFHWGIINNTRGKNTGNFIVGFGYKFW